MARARPEQTRYPGVHKRTLYAREGGKGQAAYDIKIGNEWVWNFSSNLEEARQERERLVAETQGGGTLRGRQQTLKTFVETTWLPRQEARVAQGKIRSSTLVNYRCDLTNHVLPAFGECRLNAITPGQIQTFADELSASGKANNTVQNILKPLSSAFRLAKKDRLVQSNPVSDVEKPDSKPRREVPSLSVAQVRKLAKAAPTVDDRNLILVAAFAGLRAGELYGLRWSSVTLDKGEETIRVAEQFYDGEVVDQPKTAAGRREVILSPPAIEALQSQYVESKRLNPLGLVFPSIEGKHLRASNWNRRVWQDTRKAAGLDGLHFHDLRHFFVSHVRNANLPAALSQQLVGQSDEKTHDGYTYAIPGSEVVIRAALGSAFAEDAAA